MTTPLSSTHPFYYGSQLVKNTLTPLFTSLQRRVSSVAFLAFAVLAGTLYLVYCHYRKRKAPPHILLHFDINGTIFAKDKKKEKLREDYMLLLSLARSTVSKWDGENGREMSFKQYVDQILHPGDKSHPTVKEKREEAIMGFLDTLKRHDPALSQQVQKKYEESLEKCTSLDGEKRVYKVFPSFFSLLQKLRSLNIPFTIIFRTFGDDLNSVREEIEGHPSGIQITHSYQFSGRELTNKTGDVIIDQVAHIFQTILSSKEHWAIQDDWKSWNADQEKGQSGKPFFYDPSRKSEVLSLFFDDNITGERECDIICPCPLSEEKSDTTQSLIDKKLLVPVNTIDAILDNNYFTNKVLEAIHEV